MNGQPPSNAKSCFSPGGAQCPVSRHPGRPLRFPVAVCGELRLSELPAPPDSPSQTTVRTCWRNPFPTPLLSPPPPSSFPGPLPLPVLVQAPRGRQQPALCISFCLRHERAVPRDVRIPLSDEFLEGSYLCLSVGATLFSEARCVLENILNTE